MPKLTNYERETIFNYNQEEKTASCYTHDSALIRKLDRLCLSNEAITVCREGEGWKEYNFPKSWLKVRPPRQLSDEKRAELANRMKSIRKEDKTDGMAE